MNLGLDEWYIILKDFLIQLYTLLDLAVNLQSLRNSTASMIYWRMQSRARVRDYQRRERDCNQSRVRKGDGTSNKTRNAYPKWQIVSRIVRFTSKTNATACIYSYKLKQRKKRLHCKYNTIAWFIGWDAYMSRRFYLLDLPQTLWTNRFIALHKFHVKYEEKWPRCLSFWRTVTSSQTFPLNYPHKCTQQRHVQTPSNIVK